MPAAAAAAPSPLCWDVGPGPAAAACAGEQAARLGVCRGLRARGLALKARQRNVTLLPAKEVVFL